MPAAARPTATVRSLVALLALLGLAIGAIPFFLRPPAGLELRLRDALFATDLAGVTVRLTNQDEGLEMAVVTERDDHGFIASIERIRSGEVALALAMDRFEPTDVRAILRPLEVTRVDVSLVPNFGRLEISVVDARAPDRIVTATADVRLDGKRSTASGEVLQVAVDPGRHTIEAAAAGFCSFEREVDVRQAETTRILLPLPPVPSGAERARIILDWIENPRDLDAHVLLSGSSAPVQSTHVYFKNLRGSDRNKELWAELDVDWRHSEGFETVTIYDAVDGVFQFFVHHFAGSGSLASSEATVEIITAGCQRHRITVPEPCEGHFWYVADIKISALETVFVERDLCQDRMPIQWKPGKAEG